MINIIQIALFLITVIILILNVIFIYYPLMQIKNKVKKATTDIDLVTEKISTLESNLKPKIDQILQEALSLEQKINKLYNMFTSSSGISNPSSILQDLKTLQKDSQTVLNNISSIAQAICPSLSRFY